MRRALGPWGARVALCELVALAGSSIGCGGDPGGDPSDGETSADATGVGSVGTGAPTGDTGEPVLPFPTCPGLAFDVLDLPDLKEIPLAGDLNADGNDDFIVPGGQGAAYHLNRGGGVLRAAERVDVPGRRWVGVAVEELKTGEGDALVFAQNDPEALVVFKWEDDRVVQDTVLEVDTPLDSTLGVAAGDFNGDGRPDLLAMTDGLGTPALRFFEHRTDGSFGEGLALDVVDEYWSPDLFPRVADFDGDGIDDLHVGNTSVEGEVYLFGGGAEILGDPAVGQRFFRLPADLDRIGQSEVVGTRPSELWVQSIDRGGGSGATFGIPLGEGSDPADNPAPAILENGHNGDARLLIAGSNAAAEGSDPVPYFVAFPDLSVENESFGNPCALWVGTCGRLLATTSMLEQGTDVVVWTAAACTDDGETRSFLGYVRRQ